MTGDGVSSGASHPLSKRVAASASRAMDSHAIEPEIAEGQWPLNVSCIKARFSLETVAPPTHEGPVGLPRARGDHELMCSCRESGNTVV